MVGLKEKCVLGYTHLLVLVDCAVRYPEAMPLHMHQVCCRGACFLPGRYPRGDANRPEYQLNFVTGKQGLQTFEDKDHLNISLCSRRSMEHYLFDT